MRLRTRRTRKTTAERGGNVVDPTRKNVIYEKELSLLTVSQLCERWDEVVTDLREFLHSKRPTIFEGNSAVKVPCGTKFM